MPRTNRTHRDKQFDDFLPQTACTSEMYKQAKELADKEHGGSIGALIRVALQEKFDQGIMPKGDK